MSDDSAVKVKVAVRVRPFNRREKDKKSPNIIEMKRDGVTTNIDIPAGAAGNTGGATGATAAPPPKTFSFDHSFWSHEPTDAHFANQEIVYKALGEGVLENAFDGYNACIFAYGQTGSGKTYTMMGAPNDEGIIPRLCRAMFDRISIESTESQVYKVEVSYMEIYNENVRDLLNPSNKKKLRVREHKTLGPYVENLSQLPVANYTGIEALMEDGGRARTVAATMMNSESSRSHAVFTILLTQTAIDAEAGTALEKVSRVSLVDLAGSERVSKTGAAGDRLKEAGNINKSLTTLGLVIANLADQASGKKGGFVPYRDSVLTWLLKDNLGGNAKTVMVATVSPAADNYEESMSTLRYADRAKRIVNHAIINEDANARIIRELREELARLRDQMGGAALPSGGGSSSGGVSAPAAPQVDTREVEELRARLDESQRLMESVSRSWEERWREANDINVERQRLLESMGISVTHAGVAVDKSIPSLINLNEDPSLTGILIYPLKARTCIGREDAPELQDMQLRGLGIQSSHAVITRPLLVEKERARAAKQKKVDASATTAQANVDEDEAVMLAAIADAEASLMSDPPPRVTSTTSVGSSTSSASSSSSISSSSSATETVDKSVVHLTVAPVNDARVCINGREIVAEERLYHGDRLCFGNNHLFRVNLPRSPMLRPVDGTADAAANAAEEIFGSLASGESDWQRAQRELARHAGVAPEVIASLKSQLDQEKETALTQQRRAFEERLQKLEADKIRAMHEAKEAAAAAEAKAQAARMAEAAAEAAAAEASSIRTLQADEQAKIARERDETERQLLEQQRLRDERLQKLEEERRQDEERLQTQAQEFEAERVRILEQQKRIEEERQALEVRAAQEMRLREETIAQAALAAAAQEAALAEAQSKEAQATALAEEVKEREREREEQRRAQVEEEQVRALERETQLAAEREALRRQMEEVERKREEAQREQAALLEQQRLREQEIQELLAAAETARLRAEASAAADTRAQSEASGEAVAKTELKPQLYRDIVREMRDLVERIGRLTLRHSADAESARTLKALTSPSKKAPGASEVALADILLEIKLYERRLEQLEEQGKDFFPWRTAELEQQMIDAVTLVREANAMAKELGKPVVYDVIQQIPRRLLSAGGVPDPAVARSELAVQVTDVERHTRHVWSLAAFQGQMFPMRDMYHRHVESAKDGYQLVDESSHDGGSDFFREAEFCKLIGVASFSLRSLEEEESSLELSAPLVNEHGVLNGELTIRLERQVLTATSDAILVAMDDTIPGTRRSSVRNSPPPKAPPRRRSNSRRLSGQDNSANRVSKALNTSASVWDDAIDEDSETTQQQQQQRQQQQRDEEIAVQKQQEEAERARAVAEDLLYGDDEDDEDDDENHKREAPTNSSSSSTAHRKAAHKPRPKFRISVTVREARRIPVELSSLVFCVYRMWQFVDVSVPSLDTADPTAKKDTTRGRAQFGFEYIFEGRMTPAFRRFLRDGTLGIEVWGHSLLKQRRLGIQEQQFPAGWSEKIPPIVQDGLFDWADTVDEFQLFVTVMEPSQTGEWLEVDTQSREDENNTGGLFIIRQGYARRIVASVVQARPSGLMVYENIVGIAVGDLESRSKHHNGAPQLVGSRSRGRVVDWPAWQLEKRREELDEQLEALVEDDSEDEDGGGDGDDERKKQKRKRPARLKKLTPEEVLRETLLLEELMALVHARKKQMLVEGGVVGGAAGLDAARLDEKGNQKASSAVESRVERLVLTSAGANEASDEAFAQADALTLVNVERDGAGRMRAVASWDGSMHRQNGSCLMRATAKGERIYAVVYVSVKVTGRSEPLVLRKRICVKVTREKRTSLLAMWRGNGASNSDRSGVGADFAIVTKPIFGVGGESEEDETRKERSVTTASASLEPGMEGKAEAASQRYWSRLASTERFLAVERARQLLAWERSQSYV